MNPDDEGNTPLHLAVKNQEYFKAKLLLITDIVDLRAINKEGLAALDWKISYEKVPISYFILWQMIWFVLQNHHNHMEIVNAYQNDLFVFL